jgi:hypothetical protein
VPIWVTQVLEGEHIGNFYHSQSVVMLFGKREPFYMLFGCYIWFQYVTIALAWEAKLDFWGEIAVASLLLSFGWGILDTVGIKQLWWTWHNAEPLRVTCVNPTSF